MGWGLSDVHRKRPIYLTHATYLGSVNVAQCDAILSRRLSELLKSPLELIVGPAQVSYRQLTSRLSNP
jgi:hypothetical protein